ncbi:MAG: TonB-dependent receptor [Pseudomonadota bacterium]|jgi:iron complex outermembrane receptor protein
MNQSKLNLLPRHRLAVAMIAALASAQASAQQPAAEDEQATLLDTLVVTAQKREQSLQEVPVALTYVDGSQIETLGGYNVEQLKLLVPSLNIRKTNTALNQALFLRGVGTINFAIAAQPSVASVLDGVVLSSAGEAFGDLYDIERIEVLRGPQGTLFGKNASAGVVNIVSKMPTDDFGAYFDLGWFEDNEKRIRAAVNAPFSPTLRSRTTVTWGDFDGYIDNLSSTPAGGKLNGYDRKGIRTVWQADPSDSTQITFIADYRDSDDNCCVEVIGTAPTGANGPALNSLLRTNFRGDATREVRQNLEMRSTEEAWGLSLQADVSLENSTLTSITAYRTWDTTEFREGDWLDTPAAYVGNAFAQLHDFGPQETDTFSQELRLAGSTDIVDYVLGAFYSKTDAERFFRRDTIVCRSTTSAPDSTGLAPCRPGSSVVETPSANALFGADFKNLAVFADGTFPVTDSWNLIGGLRWTKDEISYQHRYNFSPIPGPGIRTQAGGGTAFLSGEDDSTNVSGRAGLQWDVNDDLMSYLTYSRGYKGPAFNVFFNMGPNNTPVIDAETADSYELGFKSTLGDGRYIVSGAAFSATYDNFQANNFLFLNGALITTLTNAGEVKTEGLELEILARPTEALSISGGVAYTDARVESFPVPATAPPGTLPTVRSGTQLPLAPKRKASLAGQYQFDFDSFNFSPGLVVAYQDEQWSDLNEPAALRIPGYTTVDLTFTFADKDDRYRLTLIGRNVTDQQFVALRTAGGPGGVPRLQIPRDADRYFGLQFRMNFGAP